MKKIYHIEKKTVYEEALKAGVYTAPSLDSEGYIHCSYAEQVCRIGNLFYRESSGLILMEIDRTLTGCKVIDEDLSDLNEPFPHIYGKLPVSAVIRIYEFEKGSDGLFLLPDLKP